jgi:hypothetical protein
VSRTCERRPGSLRQESPDAAGEHENDTPSDKEALAALFTLRAWLGGSREPQTYDQWHLPPDVKSADAYKRRHRELRRSRVAGAWVRGKVLACTPEAWATALPRSPRLSVVQPARDVDAELDAALGIKTRQASR